MTGTHDPLMTDGGLEFVIGSLDEPWRTFWKQVALVDELDDKIIFAAPAEIAPYLVASAPKLRAAMKSVHCSTPDRYRIEIQTMDGDTVCI